MLYYVASIDKIEFPITKNPFLGEICYDGRIAFLVEIDRDQSILRSSRKLVSACTQVENVDPLFRKKFYDFSHRP